MTLSTSYYPADQSGVVLDSTVGSILREAAEKVPDQLAIIAYGHSIDDRRTWTYAELLSEAERTARALLNHFDPGEHVAVWANNTPEWVFLELGAGLAKIVLVTVNPGYKARELDYVLRQSKAAGLFHVRQFRGNRLADTVAKVTPEITELKKVFEIESWDEFIDSADESIEFPEVSPNDPVQIQYTSGTTGFPKGALLHHRGLTNNGRLATDRWQVRQGDIVSHSMPFFHTAGCGLMILGCISKHATHLFPAQFDPALMIEIIEREKADLYLGVPTMLISMMSHPEMETRDVSSVRVVGSGGALVPPEVVRAIESRFGAEFSIVYGQTETSPVITQVPLDASLKDKSETIGPPLPETEVKIVDPSTGDTLPVGQVGELCTRGYLVMHEYFDNEEATASTIDPDGWLHTGDLATMDERGYCRITGRIKEMVIRGGENLFPAEIESVLHEHPAIIEAAVVGVPDARMGEELAAFIRTPRNWKPDIHELRAHVRESLAAYKTPLYWILIDEFPLTGSGKIQKFVLRERWEEGVYTSYDWSDESGEQ